MPFVFRCGLRGLERRHVRGHHVARFRRHEPAQNQLAAWLHQLVYPIRFRYQKRPGEVRRDDVGRLDAVVRRSARRTTICESAPFNRRFSRALITASSS